MFGGKIWRKAARRHILLIGLCTFLFFASSSESAEVIIVGDTQLTPVVSIISGIKEKLESPVRIYTPSNVRGRLQEIAAKEDSKVVVALGRDAIRDALQLPSSYIVIYDLVIVPLAVSRPNTTGFYMATPVKEYVDIARHYMKIKS